MLIQANFVRRSAIPSPQFSPKPWRPDVEKIKCFTRIIHRALLARFLTLRESACVLYRRFGDIYRSGCFSFHQDFTTSRGQRILLGACLISFAQDSISEDEIMTWASYLLFKFTPRFPPELLRRLMSRSTMKFRNLFESSDRRKGIIVLKKCRNNLLSVCTAVLRVPSHSTSEIYGSSCERGSRSSFEISFILKRTSLCPPVMV